MRPDDMSKRAEAVTIRLARLDEHQALEALQRRASLALPEYRAQLLANPDAIELPIGQIENGGVLVAEMGARLAGFAALAGSELDGLFVEPDLWRKGIGGALVEAATHQARRAGLTVTVIASPGARGFYERCGFIVEGDEQTRFGPAIKMSR